MVLVVSLESLHCAFPSLHYLACWWCIKRGLYIFLTFFFPPGEGGVKEAFESYRFNCEGKMYILMQIFLVGNGKCFVIIIDNPKRLI